MQENSRLIFKNTRLIFKKQSTDLSLAYSIAIIDSNCHKNYKRT